MDFKKEDTDMANLIKIDKNGTKYWEGFTECPRCSGVGIYYIGTVNGRPQPSWVDEGICFQCGGSGKVIGKWKEYTPEYEAKLEAQRAKRRAKAEAELEAKRAEEEAKRAEEEARKEADEKAKAEEEAKRKAISQYVGTAGDKLDITATYDHSAWYERQSFRGYGTETVYLHFFRDEHGNLLIRKTGTNRLGRFTDEEWKPLEEGTEVHLRGTIKGHNEYKDEKQTILTRCKVEW